MTFRYGFDAQEMLGSWEMFCQNSFRGGIPKLLLTQGRPSFLVHKGDRRLCIASQTSEEDSGYTWAECEWWVPCVFREHPRTLPRERRERERRQTDRQSKHKADRCPHGRRVEILTQESHHFCLFGTQQWNKRGHEEIFHFHILPFIVQTGKGELIFPTSVEMQVTSVLKVWESDFHPDVFQVWGRKSDCVSGAWVRERQPTEQVWETERTGSHPHFWHLPAVCPSASPSTSQPSFLCLEKGDNNNDPQGLVRGLRKSIWQGFINYKWGTAVEQSTVRTTVLFMISLVERTLEKLGTLASPVLQLVLLCFLGELQHTRKKKEGVSVCPALVSPRDLS